MLKITTATLLLTLPLIGGEVEEVDRIAQLPRWKAQGVKFPEDVEARQWDMTRVDMVTDTHAIEVDWAPKWAEAIGQALYYAELAQKKAGIILLVKDIRKEARYVYRCQTVCAKHGIRLWIENVAKTPTPKARPAAPLPPRHPEDANITTPTETP